MEYILHICAVLDPLY